MKIDNQLFNDFLLRYPKDAARVLELLSAEDVAALLNELPNDLVTPVLEGMLPERAAIVISKLAAEYAAKLLVSMPTNCSARIYFLLDGGTSKEINKYLSKKVTIRMEQIRNYAPYSAGDLMDRNFTMFPGNLTVGDAVRRIERDRSSTSYEIYIVDENFHLLGVVEMNKLVTSNHHAKLIDIMNRSTTSLTVNTKYDKLVNFPEWDLKPRLPVIDKDKVLVGVLNNVRLHNINNIPNEDIQNPLENMLSIVSLFWISMVELLNSLFSVTRNTKGE